MKTKLSIEQSARLVELGVDANKASMVSWKQTENWQRKSVLGDKEHLQLKPFRPMVMGFERFDCKDIFTLTDILSILPKSYFSEKYYDTMNLSIEVLNGKWFVNYRYYCGGELAAQDVEKESPELIDALYQLLIWCLTEKKIKLNTDKK